MKDSQIIRFFPNKNQAILSGKRVALLRKITQIGMILALVLIPVSGLFRIDVSSGFIVLGREIWFSDFLIVFGFWLALACTAIMVYSIAGTAFCGWACPHNTFSNWANDFTFKHLGKRAVVDWELGTGKIASAKNSWVNWFWLSVKILLISMLAALIPLFYFTSPDAVWAFVTFQQHEKLASSLYWIYAVFVFIFLVNFGVVRHFACRYMCVYRMWRFLFKTSDTLHINYDESRRSDCEKCNYCVTECMVQIDPKSTSTFDSCTNCGACITACDQVHEKKKQPGLLSFKLGRRKERDFSDGTRLMASLGERVKWVIPVWLIGAGLFTWGMMTYQPFQMSVYKADIAQANQVSTYRVHLASKTYNGGVVNFDVEGIDPSFWSIGEQTVEFDSVGRRDLLITISPELKPGVYSLIVRATSNEWSQFYRVQHLVTRN